MAKPNIELIDAFRATADRLRNGAYYAWGNHGACNCGNLVQSVTSLSKEEILKYAQSGIGEWTELAEDYCGDTNAPVNLLMQKLEMLGLTPADIHNIEYLQDKEVLNALPGGFRWLKRNVREDVMLPKFYKLYRKYKQCQLSNSLLSASFHFFYSFLLLLA